MIYGAVPTKQQCWDEFWVTFSAGYAKALTRLPLNQSVEVSNLKQRTNGPTAASYTKE